ncbi:STAS/SEC14 domain-containing protein [Arthrobacter jiangjiafuii]|uniref:STAS/SEC14 domain-containing protein n=1 Tax=Arthrobacter jiangjiafuii TaxID=2817475 RepID=A0A975M6Q2_9MICC|nr:STAS/SEC14 domain-containing protein [Arthrobacter jiangjiafuii]MBP3043987.1 STAS/SEC14 domain-containing protein [Arthrobacter jiangjiafuii]QWC10981.1 STAS/SEC14 domain-containing protein [Arthrobacter jiangjiafuii]
MAAAAAMEVERLAGSRKLPMLLVLSGVETLTRGARTVFSNAHSLQAVAVLGVSPVDRVIANFLLGGAEQPCPTRYFSTESEALAWLKRKATVA